MFAHIATFILIFFLFWCTGYTKCTPVKFSNLPSFTPHKNKIFKKALMGFSGSLWNIYKKNGKFYFCLAGAAHLLHTNARGPKASSVRTEQPNPRS